MKNFYLAKAIFTCGNSAIALFLPVFFYLQHVPLQTIFLFFAVNSASHAALTRLCMRLTVRWGILRVFTIGIMLYAGVFAGMRLVKMEPILLLMLGVAYGSANAFYWTGYHLFMVARSTDGAGAKLGYLKNIGSLASMLGPLVGALVISCAGFPALFVLSSMVTLSSVVPLLREDVLPLSRCPSWSDAFAERSVGEVAALGLGFGPEDSAQNIVWPLFMVAAIGTTVMWLGTTYAIVFVAMLLVTHLVGLLVDKSVHHVLLLGALGNAAINIFRATGAVTPTNAAMVTFGAEALTSTSNIPIDSISYKRSQAGNPADYMLFREVTINAGGSLFFCVGTLTGDFTLLFWLAAIGSLMYMAFLLPGRRINKNATAS